MICRLLILHFLSLLIPLPSCRMLQRAVTTFLPPDPCTQQHGFNSSGPGARDSLTQGQLSDRAAPISVPRSPNQHLPGPLRKASLPYGENAGTGWGPSDATCCHRQHRPSLPARDLGLRRLLAPSRTEIAFCSWARFPLGSVLCSRCVSDTRAGSREMVRSRSGAPGAGDWKGAGRSGGSCRPGMTAGASRRLPLPFAQRH